MPTVLVGADICPIEGNQPYFEKGDAESLFHDLLSDFAAADLVIANLECPFIHRPTPILKTGPVFGVPPECVRGIQKAGIDVVCLANNHSFDHGAEGLRSTLKTCADAGITAVGAGESVAEARKIHVRKLGGVRVGLLAVAEHEFSIASRKRPGANPIDLADFVRNVTEHRAEFDYLIVLVHGAAEFHAPTPRIQDTCRFMVEMGANAVIVQHPHCLGGYENYRQGHIVYGQGALVMDEGIYRSLGSFHEGFLAKLVIDDQFRSTLDLIPFTQSTPVPGARKLAAGEAAKLRERVDQRSRQILDPEFVEEDWRRFCRGREHTYLSNVLGHGRILRRLNKGGLLERLGYSQALLAGVRNAIRCETHREAIETIFRMRDPDSRC
ncbi:MAG: CapA family protein [Verrucomicrobiales bacterium]|nr:CapA family protein [Verrucomicrobiales bacterium]